MDKHIVAGAIALCMTALGMGLMVLLYERQTEKVVIEARPHEDSSAAKETKADFTPQGLRIVS